MQSRYGDRLMDESKMDPFNIGLYVIEAGVVGLVIYAMVVLPAYFKPMI